MSGDDFDLRCQWQWHRQHLILHVSKHFYRRLGSTDNPNRWLGIQVASYCLYIYKYQGMFSSHRSVWNAAFNI